MDWSEHIGSKIRIYRNLNNGTMSIQTKQSSSWKVVGHVTNAIVRDVKFHIQEGGRQRVIRDKRKNVHAWGEGVLIGQFDESVVAPIAFGAALGAIALGYDPYTNATFVERGTTRAIAKCSYLAVRNNLVFVSRDAVIAPVPKREAEVIDFDFFTFAMLAA